MNIKDKPFYCNAWSLKGKTKANCNTIPCCGFVMNKIMEGLIAREGSFKEYNKTGNHPLSYGSNKMILDPDANGKQWIYKDCFISLQDHPRLKKYCVYKENWNVLDTCSTLKECKELINNYHWVRHMLESKNRLERLTSSTNRDK